MKQFGKFGAMKLTPLKDADDLKTGVPFYPYMVKALRNNNRDQRQGNRKNTPVNVATGSFRLRMTDLSVSDLGEDFVLTRSYESLSENKCQHLGGLWLLNLGSWLERRESQVRILLPDFSIETFEPKGEGYENRRGGDCSLVLTKEKHGYSLKSIPEQKTWDYNQFGRLITIRGRCGNRVKIEYKGSYISQVILASGQILEFAYENDKLAEISDMIGRKTRYGYQGEFLTEVTYPNNGVVKYEYTDQGWIKSVTDQNGQRCVVNEYDSQGRVIWQKLKSGAETVFLYQDQDRLTTVTQLHNGGGRISYHYNRRRLVEKIVYADGSVEAIKYDDKENIIWQKGRSGHETTYIYNEASQLITEKQPGGLIHTLEYDAAGRKTADKDTSGADSCYRYDERGNLLESKSRIEGERWQTIRYAYDAKGRTVSYTDGNGNTTHYDYQENQSKPWQIKTAEGDLFTYRYDAASRLMTAESALGRKEYGYNNRGCRVLEIDGLGNTWKYEYDGLGNLTNEVRPNQFAGESHSGANWCYIRDTLGQLVSTIDPLGNTVAILRDAEGNIIKEIHPNTYDEKIQDGEGIENQYDTDNRKIKIRHPDGGIKRLKYDASGNLVKKILPEDYDEVSDDGPGYTYAYDEGNRLTKIINPEGVVEKAYVYNLAGNIVKEIDVKGYSQGESNETRPGTLYQYTYLGWLTEKRIPVRKISGQIHYQLTEYKYDNAGNVIEERRHLDEQNETSASGRVLILRFAYDKQNRLKEVKDNTGGVIEYDYNCLSQRTYEKRKINDNAYKTLRCHHDAAARLVEIEQRADREGSGDYTARTQYQLDKTGNVIKITTPAGYIIERQYDNADRLIAEIHKDKENGIENKIEFIYDKASNIIKVRDGNGAEEAYEYDLLNRTIKHTGENGGVIRTFYDKNGRVIRRILPNEYQDKGEAGQGYRYTYDRGGRITTVIAPDGNVIEANTYDQAGRLVKRRNAFKNDVDYVYDLAGRVQSIHTPGGTCRAYEYDAWGNIISVIVGNNEKTECKLDKWGRITEIIKADGPRKYYSYDYAGNISEATDGEGNTIRYEYNLINKLKTITDPTGKTDTFLYDAEGRLKLYTDKNGKQVEYSYNIYDALTEKLERNSGSRETYEYHPASNLKAALAAGMCYGYYTGIRLKEKTGSGRILPAYEYGLNGNKFRPTDIAGKTTEYRYMMTEHLFKNCPEGRAGACKDQIENRDR